MITVSQLATVCQAAPRKRLEAVAVPLNLALMLADATATLRASMFLAQIAHESAEFRYLEEIASGSAYEGRADLGNTQPGDGVRFKGRGWFQLTGRRNYGRAQAALGIPLVEHPELAAHPENAAKVAAWYWRNAEDRKRQVHDLNVFADARDVRGCTLIVNGGVNGLDQRQAYYARALTATAAPLAVA